MQIHTIGASVERCGPFALLVNCFQCAEIYSRVSQLNVFFTSISVYDVIQWLDIFIGAYGCQLIGWKGVLGAVSSTKLKCSCALLVKMLIDEDVLVGLQVAVVLAFVFVLLASLFVLKKLVEASCKREPWEEDLARHGLLVRDVIRRGRPEAVSANQPSVA